MERLVVDTDGKIVIPPEITQRCGLRPGDEILLENLMDGLRPQLDDSAAKVWFEKWEDQFTEEEKLEGRQEADRYESLSEQERDAIWNQFDISIEEDAEGDELELSATEFSAR